MRFQRWGPSLREGGGSVTSVPYFPVPAMAFDTMHGLCHHAWPLSLPGYDTGYRLASCGLACQGDSYI